MRPARLVVALEGRNNGPLSQSEVRSVPKHGAKTYRFDSRRGSWGERDPAYDDGPRCVMRNWRTIRLTDDPDNVKYMEMIWG